MSAPQTELFGGGARATFTCQLCGTTTLMPHDCPAFGGRSLPVTMTPVERGDAGAQDAAKHLADEAPGWVLAALGDMLLAHRGRDFTSDDVFLAACEYSHATRDWFALKGRDKCYGGWWMTHARLHRLERTGEQRRSQRPSRRGAWLPVWRFPDGEGL